MEATLLEEEIEADEAPEETRLTLEAARLLVQVLLERRDHFRSTIAGDVSLLQDDALMKRQRMAVEVRLGEKEIIAAALDNLHHEIESMVLDKPATNGSQVSRQHSGNSDIITSKRRKI